MQTTSNLERFFRCSYAIPHFPHCAPSTTFSTLPNCGDKLSAPCRLKFIELPTILQVIAFDILVRRIRSYSLQLMFSPYFLVLVDFANLLNNELLPDAGPNPKG